MHGRYRFGMPAIAVVAGLLLAISTGAGLVRSADAPSGSPENAGKASAKTRDALIVAFRTNLGYSREWLAAGDFKSLGQSAAALSILTDAIGRHTADAGREKIEALRRAVDDLTKAATATDQKPAEAAIARLPDLLTAAAAAPAADNPAAVRKTSAGFTPLMHLIDGTFTDARTALATGISDSGAAGSASAEQAKTYALVLAELGQYLAADRNGDQWHSQSGDLTTAAQEIAVSKSTDPKELRADFHNLYANCEACHHRR
jgi:hypothetical protein